MDVKTKLSNVKVYLQGLIKEDSSVEEINAINEQIQGIDDSLVEYNKTTDELVSAKDTIIKMVKTSGSSEEPKDPNESGKTPRTLEEIASDVIKRRK